MRKFLALILLALPLGLPIHAQYNGNATRIMGRAIKGGAPSDGNAIIWDDTAKQWKYAAASGAGGTTIAGDVTGTLAASTVVKIQGLAVKGSLACTDGQVIAWVATDTQFECVTPAAAGTPGYQPNQILGGCGVEYVSALIFNVGACSYTLAGLTYSSPVTSKTLGAADGTFDRIDVIGVDTTGAVFVLPGTAAASPLAPTTDPSTQLALTFVYVAALATTPSNVTTDNIYDENTEWTSSVTAHFNAASTSNPYRSTKDIEATAAVLTNNVQLVKPAAGTVDLATRNALIFYIRSKAAWPVGASGSTAARFLSIWWQNGATQKGSQVVLRDGAFGFSSSNTTTYQQISIPTSLFGINGIAVTTLRIQVSGAAGTSSIGFYIDAISLQGGLNPPALPVGLMSFRGTWSSATAYNPNDTVVSGGIGYIALVANTNVAVTVGATWAPVASATVVPHPFGASFDGGGVALTVGKTAYFSLPYACTIQAYNIWADTGTFTVKLWKIASGTAIPTVSNSINTSGVALSSGTALRSTTLSDFTTTTVTAHDWGAVNITAVTGATQLGITVECQ